MSEETYFVCDAPGCTNAVNWESEESWTWITISLESTWDVEDEEAVRTDLTGHACSKKCLPAATVAISTLEAEPESEPE